MRVLTHFVAEPSDPGGEMVYMLGPDWQADITHLVLDQLKVNGDSLAASMGTCTVWRAEKLTGISSEHALNCIISS